MKSVSGVRGPGARDVSFNSFCHRLFSSSNVSGSRRRFSWKTAHDGIQAIDAAGQTHDRREAFVANRNYQAAVGSVPSRLNQFVVTSARSIYSVAHVCDSAFGVEDAVEHH